jgi:hypothetical protein
MRYDKETGKILPAQIMIPFKFRDEQGNILNIDEFIIIGEDGRKMLDTSKMPEKLLQLFGFRIPTQKRNSMAAVEIVGFLPESSGDLILAPRDFVKQMGSDFDVDKLYTYMYNHYYLNGKIYTNFKSSAKDIAKLTKIVKDQITELKDNMKISKEERKLIDNYINQVLDATQAGKEINTDITQRANELISKAIAVKAFSEEAKTALNNAITQLSVLNRSYKAARQNKILDLHLEMLTSTNPEIIASIIATDTYGEFEGLAARLADIRRKKGLIKAPLTILSDIYQRGKYLNASAGKNALGAFSLDSTFNAITQGKNLAYVNLSADEQDRLFGSPMNPRTPTAEEIMIANDPIATFGTSVSKGDLSNKYTLRSQFVIAKAKAEKRDLTKEEKASLKLKSSIIAALQSTAADNEKGQILDKLNINDNSLQTIKAMTLLGFEENDIAGLITQDIIWEYFEALDKSRSSLTGYQQDAKDAIREALVAKYDPQGKLKGLSPEEYAAMAKMADKSGDELLDMLANSKFNPTLSTSYNLNQLFLLEKFLKLEEVGASIQQVQSTINTESRGVPKSLLETANKVTQIQNLGKSIIFNASELLGSYNPDTKVFEPTTISGFAAIYGTEFANTIYRPFFPYQTAGFETLFQEILTHTPSYSKSQSMAKLTEAQKTVFKGVKSFLYSSNNTNLFTGNPDQERNRLFMDVVDGNMSLASILQNLSSQTWFQKNAFLNKLDFNINTNGTPSRIEFEAATAENFDERNIYEGFLSLLDKNFPVGTFNGVEYTSRSLAQELVAAAFLEGGMQGSKQYMKYVPIAYLKTLGFGDYLSNVPFNFVSTFKGTLTESGAVYSQPSAFTRQYFQNNPELAKSVLTGDLEGKHTKAPAMSFVLGKKAMEANFVEITDPITNEPTKVQTQFLSIKEPKGKIALYEFDAIEKVYRRIPVLKDKFGFVQYNAESSKPIPLEAENAVPINKSVDIPAPNYNIQNIPAETHKEFNVDDVNNTKLPASVATLPISKTLSGTSEALDDLINALVDSGEISTANVFLLNTLQGLVRPSNFKLVYSNDASMKGNYNYETSTLTINPNNKSIKTIDDVATTLAHELVHSATGLTIKQYEAGLTNELTSEQVKAVENLKSVQNKYIEYLASQGKAAQLAAFTEDYKAWKKGNKSINFTKDQIAEFYGAMKLSEFVTMALTDVAFQERLKNIKDAEDKSLWNQIVEAITELINTLGITIPKGSILAGALKSSMDLINANQEALIEEEDVFFPDVETVTPTKEFEVVGTEILSTEDGSVIEEYETEAEAQKGLIELEKRIAARKLGKSGATDTKKEIQELFNSNPELASIGTPQQYSQYLDTIFPDSKVKNIVYHGSIYDNKKFKDSTRVTGHYFATTPKEALQHAQRQLPNPEDAVLYNILLNIKNPKIIDKPIDYEDLDTEAKIYSGDTVFGTNYDSIIAEKVEEYNTAYKTPESTWLEKQIVVFEPEQIHILGNKQDITGFKEFIDSQQIAPINNKFTYEGKTIDTAFNLTVGQDKALKRLVDFAKDKDEKIITLQGAAGTGKTAVIGYLQKYFANTGTTFVYMAPTHAATAELAFATVKSGNKELPMTVQSAVSAQKDRQTGKIKVGFTMKLTKKLGYSNNIIVLDETSMLSNKDYENLKLAMKGHDVKVIFMGDILQIPEVDVANPQQKQVSKAFSEHEQVLLTEVKRTESDAILEVLGTLRSDIRPLIPKIPNTEEIKYLKGMDYNNELVETVKDDPENSLVISYTNAGVADTNNKIRRLLGREGDLQSGDIVVGYLGYSSKQIENADIANSIRYTVDSVERSGSKYKLIVSSQKLAELEKAGVKVFGVASGSYLQLSPTDAFTFEDLTAEDFENNNKEMSEVLGRVYKAKQEALANPRRWPDFYAAQGDAARFFAKNLVGADYIYNPSTNRMEKFSSQQHGQLKKSNAELFVEKAVDFGHAVTIHKSQGSTVKNVFFDASTLPKGSSSKLYQGDKQIGNEKHSLIYVAMSRASKKLVVNTEQGQNFYSLRGPKLNLTNLQNPQEFMEMPPELGDNQGGPSAEDWDMLNRMRDQDESLADSPINKELYEKYLLLCGK